MNADDQAREIATFTETGKTVVHRGTVYSVLLAPPGNADSPYVIRSGRGRYYALTRNRPRPEHLFAIRLYHGTAVLPGWFTDRDGTVVSLG